MSGLGGIGGEGDREKFSIGALLRRRISSWTICNIDTLKPTSLKPYDVAMIAVNTIISAVSEMTPRYMIVWLAQSY